MNFTTILKFPLYVVSIVLSESIGIGQQISQPSLAPDTNSVETAPMFILASQRAALMRQEAAFVQQNGGGVAAMLVWRQQNASALASIDQQIKALCDSQQAQPLTLAPLPIPTGSTPEMKEFLQNNATLLEDFQASNNSPSSSQATPTQAEARILQRQLQLDKILTDQTSLPLPQLRSMSISPGASPQLVSYLTMIDQLIHDEAQFMSQYQGATEAAKAAALLSWHQQNVSRFQALRELARSLPVQITPTGGN